MILFNYLDVVNINYCIDNNNCCDIVNNSNYGASNYIYPTKNLNYFNAQKSRYGL